MYLEKALMYLEQDFAVIPMHYRSSQPADSLLRLDKENRANRWQDYSGRPPAMREVIFWFRQASRPNIGAVLGPVSGGLGVIEFKHDARNCLNQWLLGIGRLAAYIPIAMTAHGYTAFFRYFGVETKVLARTVDHRETIKVKGRGDNCLLPSSILPNGQLYRWHYLGYEQVPNLTDNQYKIVVQAAESLNRAIDFPIYSDGHQYNARV